MDVENVVEIAQDGVEFIRNLIDWYFHGWEDLPPEQQTEMFKGLIFLLLMLLVGWRLILAVVIGERLAVYASKIVPSTSTFPSFFEKWFREVYHPIIAKAQSEALYRRSQSASGIMGTLTAAAETVLHQSTQKLQADMLFQLIRSNPIVIKDFFVCRLVICNVGSTREPIPEYFVGAMHEWHPVPRPLLPLCMQLFPMATTGGTRMSTIRVTPPESS